MVDLRLVIGIFALALRADSACDSCTSTYTTAKGAATTDTEKCNALKTYLSCLEGKLNDATPCTLDATAAADIGTDFNAISCTLTDTCSCQKDFYGAVTTCSTAKTRISCLKGKTALACDNTATVTALAEATDTYVMDISACVTADSACFCDLEYAKASIATDAEKCSALQMEISCLIGKTGNACDGTTPSARVTAVSTAIAGVTGCITADSACFCDLEYAKASIATDAEKCSALQMEISCLMGRTGNACDGTTPSARATTVSTAIAGVTGCTSTATCMCQMNYAKTALTTANNCTAATTYNTCVGAVTTSTQLACDGTTQQSTVKTLTSGLKSIVCGAASGLKVVYLLLLLPLALFSL